MPTKSPVKEPRRRLRFRWFSEILAELKKVTWPTRKEATRLTLMVLAISVAVGIALGSVDYGFTQLAKVLFPG